MTIRERRRWCPNDRAVSEALGFLLIFTMVIVGIGLVTLYGYPMLLQQQVTADEKIMEKNMIVLQNDLKSITYKTVPYKETSLQIGSSGSFFAYNSSSTYSAFDVYDGGGHPKGPNSYVNAFHPGDLRYFSNSADTDISLQNGAVVKRQHLESGSAMLAEPRWFYDPLTNTLVINLITINSSTTLSRAGIGTVQMELGQTNYSYNTLAPGTNLYVSYTPDPNPNGQDYKEAWGNYFTQSMNMAKTATPNVYLFQPAPVNPGQNLVLVVKRYEVIIDSV
jgi:hypothetical protein